MVRPPDDLLTPLGRPGRAEEIMLHPKAHAMMVVDTAPRAAESRWGPPSVPTDTIGFDIGGHRLGWRVVGRARRGGAEVGADDTGDNAAIGDDAANGDLAANGNPAVTLEVRFVLGGVEFGFLTPGRLPDPEFHQSPGNPVLTFWDVDESCRLSSVTRRQRSRVPGLTRQPVLRCYDLAWGTERWVMAMEEFPKSFGLWRVEQDHSIDPRAPGDKIISGDPVATYNSRGLRHPAHLAWSARARLLDVIICATRGYHGDFTHLASTKPQIAYSIAADFSF